MARADDRVTHNQAKALLENQRNTTVSVFSIIMAYIIHGGPARECECARGDRMLSFDRFKMDDGGVVEGG